MIAPMPSLQCLIFGDLNRPRAAMREKDASQRAGDMGDNEEHGQGVVRPEPDIPEVQNKSCGSA
jgi:hypothetical protein